MTTDTAIDLTYVDRLVKAHPELTRTPYKVAVQDGRVTVEVDGSHREAHAWRAAIGGTARIVPSHYDVHGARRQLVTSHGISVEVVERVAVAS